MHVSRVYLSARYSRRQELNDYRAQLERIGVEVTSGWLKHAPPAPVDQLSSDDWRRLAKTDVQDVERADALVLFAEPNRDGAGGRHVEFGIALAQAKVVVVVGDQEHLFHYLPEVQVVSDWHSAMELLQGS